MALTKFGGRDAKRAVEDAGEIRGVGETGPFRHFLDGEIGIGEEFLRPLQTDAFQIGIQGFLGMIFEHLGEITGFESQRLRDHLEG